MKISQRPEWKTRDQYGEFCMRRDDPLNGELIRYAADPWSRKGQSLISVTVPSDEHE
jgi:hypothetical protein